jgi:hypothetical protein
MPAATAKAGMLTCKSPRNFVPPIEKTTRIPPAMATACIASRGSAARRAPVVRTPNIAAVSSGPIVTRSITIAEAANSRVLLISVSTG